MATVQLPLDTASQIEMNPPQREGDSYWIALDVTYKRDLSEVFEYGAAYGLESTVLNEAGPAGGWPVVKYAGTIPQIATLLANYAGDALTDEQQAEAVKQLTELAD